VISQDCKFIVSASKDKSIKIFDVQTKQQVHNFQEVHQGSFENLSKE